MEVPLIDCDQKTHSAAEIAAQIDKALSESGFMALSNLGLGAESTQGMFSLAQNFFAAPEADKNRYAYVAAQENFGFQGLCTEHLDPSRPGDLKETFTMRNPSGGSVAADRWPSAQFRETVASFYAEAMQAAGRLQQLLALALGVPDDFFVRCHGGENVTLRLLHYPPVSVDEVTASQMGAGAHTDYGMLTLLMQDDVGGLEVQDAAGCWHAVPPRPDALVINSGDLLERWSNGRYRSTWHRVKPVSGARDRYSIALFVDPDSDTVVEALPSCVSEQNPARFAPTTAGEHLQEKIEATHIA